MHFLARLRPLPRWTLHSAQLLMWKASTLSQPLSSSSTQGGPGLPPSSSDPSILTHVSSNGERPRMVDVGGKSVTRRTATASCLVMLPPETLAALGVSGGESNSHTPRAAISTLSSKKGPILGTAVVAGVMAAKRTSDTLPFCHPLPLDGVDIDLDWHPEFPSPPALVVSCTVKCTHKTGVEMEALTGCTAAALCVYDMCKASSHDITITDVRLDHKKGGKRTFYRTDKTPGRSPLH